MAYKWYIVSCSCSAFASFQAPCVHVLFQRESENIADPSKKIFEQNLFHPRYHRNHLLPQNLRNVDDEVNNDDEADNFEPAPN